MGNLNCKETSSINIHFKSKHNIRIMLYASFDRLPYCSSVVCNSNADMPHID